MLVQISNDSANSIFVYSGSFPVGVVSSIGTEKFSLEGVLNIKTPVGVLLHSSNLTKDLFVIVPKTGATITQLSNQSSIFPMSDLPVEVVAFNVFTCGVLVSFCLISILRWVNRGH